VPEGLGVVCALLFCTNHDKGFIRLKHLLAESFFVTIYT